MASLEGQRLGRYELIAAIGRGGMAEVYRARDTKLGRDVAVKLVLPSYAEPEFVERFLREARLVASLEHPNILPVYDFGEEHGKPYLVVPLVDGGALENRLGRGIVPLAKVVEWIRALAGALDYAHGRGVLHRDVKPANVLLAEGDRPFLSDFGIAKGNDATSKLTATGVVLGTPSYMAPELAVGKAAGAASDRYSLAVMAWELLAGGPPFSGDSALAVLHQHAHTPPPRLSLRAGHLPPAVDKVFDKALAKDPGARHSSAQEFAVELASALQMRSTDATQRLDSTRVILPPVAARPPAKDGVWWIVALLLIAGAALAWWLQHRPAPAPPPAADGAAAISSLAPGPSAPVTPVEATPQAAPAPVARVAPVAQTPSAPHEPVASATRSSAVEAPAAGASNPSVPAGSEADTAAVGDDDGGVGGDSDGPGLLGSAPRNALRLRRFSREEFQRLATTRAPLRPAGRRGGGLNGSGPGAAVGTARVMVEYGRGGLAYLDGDLVTARAALDTIRSLPSNAHEPPGIVLLRSVPAPLADWQLALAFGQAEDAARFIEAALRAGSISREQLAVAARAMRALAEAPALVAVVERACAGGSTVACDFRRDPR
jgi:tRNA A-37 threonylcarbamoyl transferase component Bud32